MAKKPTYEQLEQRVKELEEEAAKCKRAEETLRKAYDKLEQRIEDLTAELVKANEQLNMEIENRKRAEESLSQKHAELEATFNSIPDAVVCADLNRNITKINPGFTKLFGYKPKDVYGKKTRMLYTGEEMFTKQGKIRYNPDARDMYDIYEIEYRKKNGEVFLSETIGTPVRNEKDETIGLFGIVRDITMRKQAEEALKESEKRFRTMFDYAGDGMAIHDLDGHFFEVNQQLCDQLGYSRDELLQMRPQDVDAPEQAVQVPGHISKVLEQEHEVFETKHVRRDGSLIPVEINARLLDLSGKPAILSCARDLTERKRAEEEKKILEAKLQQAQKMEAIGTLAGGIAHDFNNLLMGIQGYSSLLMLHIDSDHPHFERLKGIQDMVQTGANLTKQLLGFARGGKYEVKPTDLNELIKQSCEMFGQTQKNIEINRKYQKGIWPVEVDRGQIQQVLLNLYVNAWHAMSGGGYIYIETSNVMLDENDTKQFNVKLGKYVKISVTDTGAGMDKTTQQKIFDPFFTTKEMGRGTGLGLASAYGIIKNHSGIIDVYSEKGKGATFNIYLPASEKEVSITKKSGADEIPNGTETVLLVDDEEMILDVGKDMLTEIGHKVLLSKSGKEAVEVYRQHKDAIDLVIVDMIMPGMGGGEAYDRMKEVDPDLKVLLSTGYSIDGEAKEILERGCDGFIQKPFTMEDLSAKIREVLGKK
jgi:two-component system cell cycle sensor histidine kinase/response regulator CckA